MQCLAYAVQKYKEETGKLSPSSGTYVQPWWNNASNKIEGGVKEYSISCWSDNGSSRDGHAIYVGKIITGMNRFQCYEANWDSPPTGRTRVMYWTAAEIRQLYSNSKEYLGCAYTPD